MDPSFDASSLQGLSQTDRQELVQFIETERQKSEIRSRTHQLTQTCWKKCVPGSIKGGKLDRGEENCLANCVDRFVDMNLLLINSISNQQR